MKFFLALFVFSACFAIAVNGQSNLRSGNDFAGEILSPSEQDAREAEGQEAEVFKILPRGMFDYESNPLSIRGGGAYYSFTKKSHSYNDTPQIELQKNDLSVGFYGANYGFIADLGEVSLSEAGESRNVSFLYDYRPSGEEQSARREYYRISKGFKTDGIFYKKSLPAVVGHTYILRAISFDEADVLIAFKIHRKETDGSLIIFWKTLKTFAPPVLIRASTEQSSERVPPSAAPDGETMQKVQNALHKKEFYNVIVDFTTKPITLRGSIPKGRLAEAIMTVMEAIGGKPVRNEMIEQ